ncbi:MAG: hypothetical protein IT557_18575 [Alphaproteobacteria bacterium]|nr:hypothetical protein [Alphaproteobacteria bacterium]
MEEILILLLVAGVSAYMAWRRRRRMRAAGMVEGGGSRAMPRLGRPGTITEAQWEELAENGFQPQKDWSEEEAQTVLDGLAYLRAAITQVTGESGAPVQVQNELLAMLLGDDELREMVSRWGRSRALPLRESAGFQRVRERIMAFWQPSDGPEPQAANDASPRQG